VGNINSVTISGNLTRDAELRMTAAGTPIINCTVAVNDRRKNQSTGEWEDYANFIDCTMFGQRAEKIAPYLTQGTKVAIHGKLHYSSWEHEGKKRSKVDVTISDIEFLSRQQAQPQTTAQQAVTQAFPGAQVTEQPVYAQDDIPF